MSTAKAKIITEAQFLEAIAKTGGNYSLMAEQLKCTRQNVSKRINDSAVLIEAVQEATNRITEISIAIVVDNIVNKKNLAVAQWWLERKGKHLGFTRQLEHAGVGGAPIQHAVTEQRADPTTPEEIAAARRRYFDDGDDAGA